MKITIPSIILLLSFSTIYSQGIQQKFVTTDIDNFWAAYDKIITTKDSSKQYDHLNTLYIEKGSEGLKRLMEVRQKTASHLHLKLN